MYHPGFVRHVSKNFAIYNAQHLAQCREVGGKQIAQRKGKTDDPLEQWHTGETSPTRYQDP